MWRAVIRRLAAALIASEPNIQADLREWIAHEKAQHLCQIMERQRRALSKPKRRFIKI